MLTIEVKGRGLEIFSRVAQALGDGTARVVYARAINATGRVAGTATGRALAKQTGLKTKTTMKAVRQKVVRATPATLTYTIHGGGGNISLKHFKPRETRGGVSAAPWNRRGVYPSTFMKAGFWPKRVVKGGWNGHVFSRTGVFKKTRAHPEGMDQFRKEKSGLYIPDEMVKGATGEAWDRALDGLEPRVMHAIDRVTEGIFS